MWAPAVAASLALLLYAPAIRCGFVFDDAFAITGNRDTTSDLPVTDLFFHDFWGKCWGVAGNGMLRAHV